MLSTIFGNPSLQSFMKVNTARSTNVAKLSKFSPPQKSPPRFFFFSECFTELFHSIFGQPFWTFVFSFSSNRSVLHSPLYYFAREHWWYCVTVFLRTDWLNVSLLLFQIWYLASRIFRSLFPNTQGAVTRFNPYEFLVRLSKTLLKRLTLSYI